jgi:hypothetical protein
MCITIKFCGKTKHYIDYSVPVTHYIKLHTSTESLPYYELHKTSIKVLVHLFPSL